MDDFVHDFGSAADSHGVLVWFQDLFCCGFCHVVGSSGDESFDGMCQGEGADAAIWFGSADESGAGYGVDELGGGVSDG